jgi:hypothetical protein
VAGEAVGEEEVRHVRGGAQHGVLVERVVVVLADPGVEHAEALEAGMRVAMTGQMSSSHRRSPSAMWKSVGVRQVVGVGGAAREVVGAVGAEEDARGVDGEGKVLGQGFGGGEAHE